MRNPARILTCLLIGGSLGAVPCTVLADTNAQQSDDSTALQEVVVTAERRQTNAQTTPLALTAITGTDLRDRHITDMQSLAGAVPNVDFGNLFGAARIAIRGISWDNQHIGEEGVVAYSVDGVYVSRPAAIPLTFFDVDRVEVVRGPQGTLYGRNATAGAVNVITADPTDTPSGYLSVDVGNYNTANTTGAVSGPISSTVSGRIAFQTNNHSGYGTNFANNLPVDDANTRAVRGKLKLAPSKNITAILSAEYSSENDHTDGLSIIGLDPRSTGLVGVAVGGHAVTNNPHDMDEDAGPLTQRWFFATSADVDVKLGSLDFRSITGYRGSSVNTLMDQDYTSARLVVFYQMERAHQITQEFRLSRQYDRGDWLVGAYYYNQRLWGGNSIGLAPAFLNITGTTVLKQGLYRVGALDTDAYAVFGQARYKLTDRLALSVGARESWERAHVDEFLGTDLVNNYSGPSFTPPVGATSQVSSQTWNAFTPKATLEYRAARTVLLYATYAQGFKSGGFNLGVPQPAYNPEKLTDYEAGIKADWAGGRVRTNVSGFWYNYKNLQVNVDQLVGGIPAALLINAPAARIRGVEAEIIALPAGGLRLELSGSALDAKYLTLSAIDPNRVNLGLQNLSGRRLLQAPPYTVNTAAEYTWLASVGKISLRGEAQWEGRVYFTSFNTAEESRAPYDLLNAYLNYATLSGNWTAQAYIRNIQNRTIVGTAFLAPASAGYPLVGSVFPPRTFGIELGYRF
jgi:iron complex outermembrane receptor protein